MNLVPVQVEHAHGHGELAQQLKTVEQAAKALRGTDAQLAQIRIKPKTVEQLDERRAGGLILVGLR
jgi:hypothetical protein